MRIYDGIILAEMADIAVISFNTIIFVLETHGALGDEAMKLLHRIAEKKGGGKNDVSAQFLRFSLARIGVALQRGNAVILRHWRSACVPAGNRIVM